MARRRKDAIVALSIPIFTPSFQPSTSVIPALYPVIPALYPVIPAKAGIQRVATKPAT